MPRSTRATALQELTESALRHGGTPKYAEVVRRLSGWGYNQVYKLWQRERAKTDAPKPKPPAAPPPPTSDPPESKRKRPDPPDPAVCEERAFWEWRVRDLAFDLEDARGSNSWPAVAGLSKQLHEARATLAQIVKETEDPLGESLDDLLVQLEILSRDLPPEGWHAFASLLQVHHGVRILVPRPDGGPAMMLTEEGWEPIGPAVPWDTSMRVTVSDDG